MELTKSISLFGRTKELEGQIDDFLDKLSQCSLLYKIALQVYLSEGCNGEFEQKLQDVNKMESSADDLRRSIETKLYAQTLIPESRGDVLGLIENLDQLMNLYEGSLWAFSIEAPFIPKEFHNDFLALADLGVLSVESLVLASRAFFRNIDAVGDHNHKVMFFEKEADKVSTKLKRKIFGSELDLSQKMHMRNFVEDIDNVSDWAEDVADRLAIYTIKRTV
jgi:predicted phosphate transport protein (TIGR00153 family)